MSDIGTSTPLCLLLTGLDRSIDQQVVPLRVIHGSERGQDQFFLPIQKKEGEPNPPGAMIDNCQGSTVEISFLHMEESFKLLHDNQLTSPLTSIKTDSSIKIDPFRTGQTETNGYQTQPAKRFIHISDRIVPPRAIAVLPEVLQIRQKGVISPRRALPPHARFGPVQGIKTKMSYSEAHEIAISAITNKLPLFLSGKNGNDDNITNIDITDKDKSNWIGLLPLGDDDTANLWLYEENNELYAITTDTIPCRKPLMLGYSKKYALDYGLTGPTKDIAAESSFNTMSWWCFQCHRAMPSANILRRHTATYHQDHEFTKRRRYRCRHCSLTFCRTFTLRRHLARHCRKKADKSATLNVESQTEGGLNSSMKSEENRVSSDESFQNYSNGLDFSTNLFDTDRISSLDMSGNSRCEVFNPYGLTDSSLTNDLGYSNGSLMKTDLTLNTNDKEKAGKKDTEISVVICGHCKQEITKAKRRVHARECPARRFECECKKVFSCKEDLAQHIYTQHSNEQEAEKQEKNAEVNKSESTTTTATTDQEIKPHYECEQCQLTFKRRGMLVNHLWRTHGTEASSVPLARRVRHYPCGVCPKLYTTAAKRDQHLLLHHPGASVRAQCMEGEWRACAPAACALCPRQYTTRAKLLQHQRREHPHAVPAPLKKNNKTKKTDNANERFENNEDLKSKPSLQQLLNFY